MCYATVAWDQNIDTVLDMNGIQEHTSQCTGPGPKYDVMNQGSNPTIGGMWERKHMFLIEDKHMNYALCNISPTLLAPKIQ